MKISRWRFPDENFQMKISRWKFPDEINLKMTENKLKTFRSTILNNTLSLSVPPLPEWPFELSIPLQLPSSYLRIRSQFYCHISSIASVCPPPDGPCRDGGPGSSASFRGGSVGERRAGGGAWSAGPRRAISARRPLTDDRIPWDSPDFIGILLASILRQASGSDRSLSCGLTDTSQNFRSWETIELSYRWEYICISVQTGKCDILINETVNEFVNTILWWPRIFLHFHIVSKIIINLWTQQMPYFP